ncbi:hypothetical protein HMPREF1768_01112, partial [Fusobacterium nucleatum CTI-7]
KRDIGKRVAELLEIVGLSGYFSINLLNSFKLFSGI